MNDVLVVLDAARASAPNVASSAAAFGILLADSLERRASLIAIGHLAATVAARYADTGFAQIDAIETVDEALDPKVAALEIVERAKARPPSIVVLPMTMDALAFGPRLALLLGIGIASNVTGVGIQGEALTFVRQIQQGREEEDIRFDNDRGVVLARPGAGDLQHGRPPVTVITSTAAGLNGIRHITYETEGSSSGELERARVIVAMGRGAGGPENVGLYEELAAAIGAQLGGSRPVIDAGWLPRARQIGVSGATVKPTVYLGFGVSGALGHQAGMRGSRTIVAINLDEDAPLMGIADYRVLADATEVAAALLAGAKAGAERVDGG